ALRGEVGAFQKNIIGARLEVVEATLQSTAQTRSMIQDTDFARQTAELVRNQTLAQTTQLAAGQAIRQAAVGSLLDVTA
ncbi:MAG: flagellin, partial [Planctomycetota bacterium]